MLLGQLPAVDVEDLPSLVKHLISSATKANAEQVRHYALLHSYARHHLSA